MLVLIGALIILDVCSWCMHFYLETNYLLEKFIEDSDIIVLQQEKNRKKALKAMCKHYFDDQPENKSSSKKKYSPGKTKSQIWR